MWTIAIANRKGGSGKTTTTVSLAGALAELGLRVLVIDLDPQTSATAWLHPEATERSLIDCFEGGARLSEVIVHTATPRIRLAPGSDRLLHYERAVGDDRRSLRTLARRLGALRRQGDLDYVLIDCPPHPGPLTTIALAAADGVVIPVEARALAVAGSVDMADTIAAVQSDLNRELELIGIVACRVDRRTTHADEMVAELREAFGRKMFRAVIRENIRLAEAPRSGDTIIHFAGHSPGAEDYRDLALELRRRTKIPPPSALQTS